MTIEPLYLVGYGSLIFKYPLHNHAFSKDFIRLPGYVKGFARRFWQSSSDNRGTPEQKGRVVTIIPHTQITTNESFQPDIIHYELSQLPQQEAKATIADPQKLFDQLTVWGCCFYIPPEHAVQASEYLDLREKDGYTTQEIEFNVVPTKEQLVDSKVSAILEGLPKNDQGEPVIKSVVYVATTDNTSFIGPEDVKDTADVIRVCHGESGPNDEYLLELHKSLVGLDPSGLERAQDPYLDDLVQLVTKP
ncbi:unnamed protein product [Ambrosiozyma monospora]|uniref:Unnamed protein product n=1 Tax=Ambrosiozyma monospora TaxID=43982 RepID=A0ACB5TA01_AMBMO|nr:unnamed protein product [Ambrosiozyma monospora]